MVIPDFLMESQRKETLPEYPLDRNFGVAVLIVVQERPPLGTI